MELPKGLESAIECVFAVEEEEVDEKNEKGTAVVIARQEPSASSLAITSRLQSPVRLPNFLPRLGLNLEEEEIIPGLPGDDEEELFQRKRVAD